MKKLLCLVAMFVSALLPAFSQETYITPSPKSISYGPLAVYGRGKRGRSAHPRRSQPLHGPLHALRHLAASLIPSPIHVQGGMPTCRHHPLACLLSSSPHQHIQPLRRQPEWRRSHLSPGCKIFPSKNSQRCMCRCSVLHRPLQRASSPIAPYCTFSSNIVLFV